ncbi:type IV secretory pathway protease TraF [Bradyrhizobium japonicum]
MTRFGYVMTTYFAMLVFIGLAFFHPAPRLIWNVTASTPTGLYALRPARTAPCARAGRRACA